VKETAIILYEDLKDYLASLEQIEDVELLTLKGHLILESCLRRLLAVRLDAAEEEIPRLAFHTLARLVSAGANAEKAGRMEKQALLLNQMRNDIAHRLSPRDQLGRMRELCALVLPKRDWPSDSKDQRELYCSAVQVLVMDAQLIGIVLQLTSEEHARLMKRLAQESAAKKSGR
jgi:hypothetical protein